MKPKQTHKGEVFASDFKGCEALSAETSHKGCRTNEKQISLKSTAKTSPKLNFIKRSKKCNHKTLD